MKQLFRPVLLLLFIVLVVSTFFLYRTWRQYSGSVPKTSPEKSEVAPEVPQVSSQEVYQLIRQPDAFLLDIRPATEFAKKHIESSINIPLDKLKNNVSQLDQKKKIIIIDREVSAEEKILVDYLRQHGYQAAYLSGGILSYAQHGYPLVTIGDPNNPTDLLKVEMLSAEEVRKKLLQGTVFAFIDTRSPYAFRDDHIEGSLNFPLENIEADKEKLPAKILLLYDNDPLRSWRAGVKLYDMGLANFFVCQDDYQRLKEILFKEED